MGSSSVQNFMPYNVEPGSYTANIQGAVFTIWDEIKHHVMKAIGKLLSAFINSYPPGQNGRHFADDIFRCIFVNEKFCILIKISLKFVLKGPIENNTALV